MAIAIFPGRFDPVTNGHVDIVLRAAKLFDHLVVAVLDVSSGALFPIEERIALFAKAVESCQNVTVKPYRGLTVEFARQEGASVLVRGIRAVTGFEAEFDMALMNKRMEPEIETVCLMASLEHLFISGSRIREVAGLGYDVTNLVPRHVAEALRAKFSPDRTS
ncbi:MAG: pantetheine-phosphate adenylyltransferase [Chloroflexi bacterium RBG_16_68_14]|nr:MAG: pantetheine-phosphate adenylyltransferase [Chloroflexi bacterium RBG_16_68_14]